MTKQELCNKLIECRKASNLKMKDICFQMNMMPTGIYRLENEKNNSSIDNILLYLKILGYGLYLITDKKTIHFNNRETFSSAFKAIREELNLSQTELAHQINLSRTVITGIERGIKNTPINQLLICISGINCTLEIKKL